MHGCWLPLSLGSCLLPLAVSTASGVLLGCGLADWLGMLGHSHAAVKDGDKKDKKDLKPVERGMKVGWPLDRPCSSLSS